MIIDPITHKVDPSSLTEPEAIAFIVFLESECQRHWDDIHETNKLIQKIKGMFSL